MTSSRHDLALALTARTLPLATTTDVSSFWELARREGVLPLLVEAISGAAAVPPAMSREARDGEARAVLAERDLRAVLAEFERRHIRVLVIKGAALAHSLYRTPGLRPRLDTDLLIGPADVERVHALFRDAGGAYVPHVTGEYVMSQFHYLRTDAVGCVHAYDIHWRVVNPPPFAPVFNFDGLWERRIELSPLGAIARAPSFPDALLIACVHRAAHHGAGGPLIWLWDVHLLAEALDEPAHAAFASAAREHRVTAIASHALLDSASLFGSACARSIGTTLRTDASRAREPSAAYLERRTRLEETIGDLRGMTWRAGARYVRELAFPSAEYMRGVYAADRRGTLPWLYLRRLSSGIARWARRRR